MDRVANAVSAYTDRWNEFYFCHPTCAEDFAKLTKVEKFFLNEGIETVIGGRHKMVGHEVVLILANYIISGETYIGLVTDITDYDLLLRFLSDNNMIEARYQTGRNNEFIGLYLNPSLQLKKIREEFIFQRNEWHKTEENLAISSCLLGACLWVFRFILKF